MITTQFFTHRLGCSLALAATLLGVAAANGRAQTTVEPPPQPQPAAPVQRGSLLQDDQREIGPFKLKNHTFTVVLHLKLVRAVGRPEWEAEETVSQLQIRDEAGTIHYEAFIPFVIDENHFAFTTEVEAKLIQGRQGGGILLTYGEVPSTPLGGQSWQLFGMFNDKLVPFSKRITLEGSLLNAETDEAVVKTSTEPKLVGDVLRFRIWTGNVFVVVPVSVDWLQAQVRPSWRCQQMTSKGWQPICNFQAEGERFPSEDAMTFVRLLPESFEPDAQAQHIVVKKDSKVELLGAAGIVGWDEFPESIGLGVGEDLWLKVRIDGKEGWIHTQEDLTAIGFPQAG